MLKQFLKMKANKKFDSSLTEDESKKRWVVLNVPNVHTTLLTQKVNHNRPIRKQVEETSVTSDDKTSSGKDDRESAAADKREVAKKKPKDSKSERKKKKKAEKESEEDAAAKAYLEAVKGFSKSVDSNDDGEGGKWLVR